MPEKKPMNAAQARKKAQRAKETKEATRAAEANAAHESAKGTVAGLFSMMEARARKEIAQAVESGDSRTHCYFGSWNWTDPSSAGSSMAANKLAEILRKEGYNVDVKCDSHFRHTDGDGYPSSDEGSSSAAMSIAWGDDE